MNRVVSLLFISSLVISGSCTLEKDKDGEGDPDSIYFDYQVTGEEGNDNLTILLQYRAGGEDEDAIGAGDANGVTLDGETIPPDTTRSGDIFYELHKPIAAFAGKHQIIFRGTEGKEYREEFSFDPLVLLTSLPDTISRDSLVVEFSGLKSNDQLRVILTDTAFGNEDGSIDEVVGWITSSGSVLAAPVKRQLVVTPDDLLKLCSGPVQFEFIKETDKEIEGPSRKGGRLLVTYALKRELFLKD